MATPKPVPRWAIITGIVAAGLIALVLILDKVIMPALVHSASVVTVPNVVGRPASQAVNDLTTLGFAIAQVDTHPDERYAAGTVLYQNPYGGAEVKDGRKVFLTISSGRELLSIPNLVGAPLREAKIKLQMAGLTTGEITYENNASVPEETVLRQSNASGGRIPIGSAIALVVSSGPEQQPTTVPSLVGRTLAEAQQLVLSSRLVFGQITYKSNHSVLPSTVLEQHPMAGDSVREGSQVQLIVAGE